MLKLIQLEWKKNNIRKYIRNALVLCALLCLFVFAMAFLGIATDSDGFLDAAEGMNAISATIEMLSGISFLIFTCVMLASFIVSAYKNGTMNLMFSYPIKRQKILLSQMAAVWLFNFTALTLTKLAVYGCILEGSMHLLSPFIIDIDMGSPAFYIQLLLKSASTVSIGFIALFAGLALKSSKAVIITSFLLVFLTQANVGDFSLAKNTVFPIILTGISLLFAALSVCGAETRDLR